MLNKINRLLDKKDYQRIKKLGLLLQGKYCGVLVEDETESEFVKVGIIVSIKISKKATQRNKIKRLIREAFQELLPKISTGTNIVVLAKQTILDANQKQIFDDLLEQIEKAGLLK